MYLRFLRLFAFAVTLLCPATAQVAILQIQFVAGEGAVHAPGSRVARVLTVELTDEIGRPVAGAAVSFHLPDEGPGGVLANRLRTDVGITDAQGRVSLRGLQVNKIPGRFPIRVVASKEQARAGAIAAQYVGESATAAVAKGRTKWVVVAAIAAGGAAAGILSAGRGGTATASPAAPVATIPVVSTVTIAAPASTVGRP